MALTTRGRAGRLIAVVTTLALGVGLGALSGVANAADASSAGVAQSGDGPQSGPAPVKGTWKQNATGWWYEYPNGGYPTAVDIVIDGVEYCFDGKGYMRTGWVLADEGWRYYYPSGARAGVGWVLVDGEWFSCGWVRPLPGPSWMTLGGSRRMRSAPRCLEPYRARRRPRHSGGGRGRPGPGRRGRRGR